MLNARYRTRGVGETVQPPVLGRIKYTSNAGKVVYGTDITSSSSLPSEERKCWDVLHAPPYHDVGTFLSVVYNRPSVSKAGGGVFKGANLILGSSLSPFAGGTVPWSYEYQGGFGSPNPKGFDDSFFSTGTNTSPDNHTSIHPDDMSSAGSAAYNAMRPKPEAFNLLQAAAELKDLPGMLKSTAGSFSRSYSNFLKQHKSLTAANRHDIRLLKQMPKRLGDEYLATTFGWAPFLSDLSNLFGLVDRVGVHIANRKKYNNVWVKRRRSVPEDRLDVVVSDATSSFLSCTPSLGSSGTNNYIMPNSARYTITQEKSTSVWYTGYFKAYRPEFDDSYEEQHPTLAKPRQVLSSLGYYVNPVVLYKLTPWTWMADYFVNIGQNVQSFQDLADNSVVSRHVCAMRHITSKIVYRQHATLRSGNTLYLEWNRGYESKYRAAGLSPFGFSLLPGGLSSQQLAILGALGMSKFL